MFVEQDRAEGAAADAAAPPRAEGWVGRAYADCFELRHVALPAPGAPPLRLAIVAVDALGRHSAPARLAVRGAPDGTVTAEPL